MSLTDEVGLLLPTLNAGDDFARWLKAFRMQTFRLRHLLVIDSSSDDKTATLVREAGFNVYTIPRGQFNHGGTRQLGVEMLPQANIIIFLTQDAVLARPSSLERLVSTFQDESVGAAYGRQLPYIDAGPIATHSRLFNYPDESRIKTKEDIAELGIKAAFMSNSFAAYRRSALTKIGGFPRSLVWGEDSYVAAKMLLDGYRIAYCADALVYHSHDYSFTEEFKRYVDAGIFHGRESWIRESFGGAEGEGIRYALSELKYLRKKKPLLIPSALLRMLLKWTAYRYGRIMHRRST